jgi:predicted hotdog family 3-hydroxylacyl-ACP dehydratase
MNFDIERLIPHRGRMKLVDKIIQVDEDAAITESFVTARWPLSQDNGVNPLVFIELTAQTAAVCIGWKKLKEQGDHNGRGWLVGIKSAVFYADTIPLQTLVRTHARINFSLDNYTEIHGEVTEGPTIMGEIILQVLRDEKQ